MALPAKDIIWSSQKAFQSSLTSLILHHSQISKEELGKLLQATSSLLSRQYDSWFDTELEGRSGRAHWQYFDCAKLGHSLAWVQGSLENLVISLHFMSLQTDVGLGGFRGMDGRLDTLHGFQKLLSLEVPSIVLLGWAAGPLPEMDDVLSPSLRHLCLTDDLHELGETEWEIETLLRLI